MEVGKWPFLLHPRPEGGSAPQVSQLYSSPIPSSLSFSQRPLFHPAAQKGNQVLPAEGVSTQKKSAHRSLEQRDLGRFPGVGGIQAVPRRTDRNLGGLPRFLSVSCQQPPDDNSYLKMAPLWENGLRGVSPKLPPKPQHWREQDNCHHPHLVSRMALHHPKMTPGSVGTAHPWDREAEQTGLTRSLAHHWKESRSPRISQTSS